MSPCLPVPARLGLRCISISPPFHNTTYRLLYIHAPSRAALVLKVKGALGLRPQCNYHNTL